MSCGDNLGGLLESPASCPRVNSYWSVATVRLDEASTVAVSTASGVEENIEESTTGTMSVVARISWSTAS